MKSYLAWHLRLRQYYPGQEVINEHNDPNLAETPHYKEKQTILPHPVGLEHEKKPHTPAKRTHDGKVKKDKEKKDLYKSPDISDDGSVKSIEKIKSKEEAKIDMRKLVIKHKSHKSSHRSGSTSKSSSKNSSSTTTKHHSSHSSSSSSSSHHRKDKDKDKEKDKHRSSSSGSSNNRSHSKSKSSSSSSSKHHRNENEKKSSSSSSNQNHSVSETIVQPNVNEIVVKKESIEPKPESIEIKQEIIELKPEIIQQSTESTATINDYSPESPTENVADGENLKSGDLKIEKSLPPLPPLPPPLVEIKPPLPPLPIESPPRVPPPPGSASSQSQTSQISTPAAKKSNNETKPTNDLLGSIMASMESSPSPRNASTTF